MFNYWLYKKWKIKLTNYLSVGQQLKINYFFRFASIYNIKSYNLFTLSENMICFTYLFLQKSIHKKLNIFLNTKKNTIINLCRF